MTVCVGKGEGEREGGGGGGRGRGRGKGEEEGECKEGGGRRREKWIQSNRGMKEGRK